MKKRAGAVSFIAVTIILVLVAAYFCAETVKCRTDVSAQEMEAFYLEKEEELVAETRAFLKKEGYENSGVMLTRVVDADGGRQYTMIIDGEEIPLSKEFLAQQREPDWSKVRA